MRMSLSHECVVEPESRARVAVSLALRGLRRESNAPRRPATASERPRASDHQALLAVRRSPQR